MQNGDEDSISDRLVVGGQRVERCVPSYKDGSQTVENTAVFFIKTFGIGSGDVITTANTLISQKYCCSDILPLPSAPDLEFTADTLDKFSNSLKASLAQVAPPVFTIPATVITPISVDTGTFVGLRNETSHTVHRTAVTPAYVAGGANHYLTHFCLQDCTHLYPPLLCIP